MLPLIAAAPDHRASAIQRTQYPETSAVEHVRVDHRRLHVRVTQQHLHRANVLAAPVNIGGFGPNGIMPHPDLLTQPISNLGLPSMAYNSSSLPHCHRERLVARALHGKRQVNVMHHLVWLITPNGVQ